MFKALLLSAAAVAALLCACEDDSKVSGAANGGASGQAGAPATAGDGATGEACLERPGELLRPPTGTLPCELFPPGYSP
jgi:hypothetical protein